MKIQLDTISKTIKLDSNINLKELVELLDKLLPNNEWKDFILETNTTINTWSAPYVIEKIVPSYPSYPRYPWYFNNSTCNDNKMLCLNKGQYNIEC